MLRLLQYYGKYQSARGAWGGLPGWARWVLLLAALPGLCLLLLSVAAFFVSLLALLLLTVPTYRLLAAMCGTGSVEREVIAPLGSVDFVEPAEPASPSTEVPSTEDRGSPRDEAARGSRNSGVVVNTTVSESPVHLTPSPRRQIEVRIVEP